ncbi:hypothetical protein [Bradyrhizobium diazoefficiens]
MATEASMLCALIVVIDKAFRQAAARAIACRATLDAEREMCVDTAMTTRVV